MIHPIPSGTRDVLPDEMRELRAITEAFRGVFESSGYGEIATPALEYEAVLTRGDPKAADPAYKLFDEHGNVLVLRSDMTIPIARVVATRYGAAEPPLRFCYFAHAYRSVRPQRGQAREMLQAGLELVGAPGPEGTAEALTVLCACLDAAGLENYRVGLGDASLYPRLLDRLEVPADARPQILHELVSLDFVGLEREVAAHGREELVDRAADARRRRGARRGAGGGRPARRLRPARAGGGRARHLRPRADPLARLLHGRRVRGLRHRARRPDGRRRPLRRPAGALRPRPAGVRVGAERRAAALARVGEGR